MEKNIRDRLTTERLLDWAYVEVAMLSVDVECNPDSVEAVAKLMLIEKAIMAMQLELNKCKHDFDYNPKDMRGQCVKCGVQKR